MDTFSVQSCKEQEGGRQIGARASWKTAFKPRYICFKHSLGWKSAHWRYENLLDYSIHHRTTVLLAGQENSQKFRKIVYIEILLHFVILGYMCILLFVTSTFLSLFPSALDPGNSACQLILWAKLSEKIQEELWTRKTKKSNQKNGYLLSFHFLGLPPLPSRALGTLFLCECNVSVPSPLVLGLDPHRSERGRLYFAGT